MAQQRRVEPTSRLLTTTLSKSDNRQLIAHMNQWFTLHAPLNEQLTVYVQMCASSRGAVDLASLLRARKNGEMNHARFSFVVVALFAAGCGESQLQNAARLAQQQLANELKASSAVELKILVEGEVIEGRLSQKSAAELSTLIEEAMPNYSSVKYAQLGELSYERADCRTESLMLLHISASEAGLCLADGTNLRKLSLSELKALIAPVLDAAK